MKSITSSFMVMLILVGTLIVAIKIEQVSSSEDETIIYIRADGSIEPSTVPIHRDGDLYTLTEDLTDWGGIVIEKDNIVLDGAHHRLVEGGGGELHNGITLQNRENVTIKNMRIAPFSRWCIYLSNSSHNFMLANDLSDISRYGGDIHLVSSSNNLIQGNNITDSYQYYDGLALAYSNNNIVVENNISGHDQAGVGLHSSSNNIISGNTMKGNGRYGGGGIWISGSSFNNSVSGNNIANNTYGILLDYSSNNTISGNNITANSYVGLLLDIYSYNNRVIGNSIANNLDWGIGIGWCSNNSVSGNTIANNAYGIYLFESSNNEIYHNNFVDNLRHICDTSWDWPGFDPSLNVWDDGYPSGGNYWDDYTGVDANNDGIGDTPYVIDETNRDRYPLMEPWTSSPPVVPATVNIRPQTLNPRSRGRWVMAYIELPEGYNVSDINLATILLNGTIPVDWDASTEIGDYDGDGVSDLMVRFDRFEVMAYIIANIDMAKRSAAGFMAITVTVTGNLIEGTEFQGSDTIRIRATSAGPGAGKSNVLK